MWELFKDSPARRDTSTTITCSEYFPLSFCKSRWFEDENVATKAVEIWPNIVQVIKHYEGLAPSKCPRNKKSYILFKHADDKLMPAKLQFFLDVSHILSEFLRGFQTNSPMTPFLFGSVETMIRLVMKMFIKEDVLNEAVTAFRLIKIKVSETSNQLAIGDAKLTIATELLLKSCSVDKAAKENFRRDCVTFLLRIVQKLQEKSPIKYQIVRCWNCFVHKAMIKNKEEWVSYLIKSLS